MPGVMLCLLVVVFALAAKASWYRAHPPAGKAIASMKAAKADTQTVDAVAQDALLGSTGEAVLFAALIAFLCLPGTTFTRSSEESLRPQAPPLRLAFARPPPVL